MRVLYVSTPSHDLATLFLYDGLCDLLGEENVVTAEHYPYLSMPAGAGGRVLAGRKGPPRVLRPGDGLFDLVVLHACFYRDHDADWARVLIPRRLAPRGVVAYVEGWDDAAGEVFPSPAGIPVHRVFRREVMPGYRYPYHATPLLWGCPAWWFDEPREEKCIDVSCLCSVAAVRDRWPIMSKVFQARTRHTAVVGGPIHFDQYLWVTRRSKYVVVPPGGGSDCVRQWEAIGAGAVPIFVGHPPRVREPWFAPDEVFECGTDELPDLLDHVLCNVDWPATQARLEKRGRAEHTTAARARRVIELTGACDG